MILIADNIMAEEGLDRIRDSALASGFGAWQPPSHLFGTGHYKGMNWKGEMAPMHMVMNNLMGQPVFPNSSFFRVSNTDTEKAMVHSDRNDGQYTAIAYLTEHEELSGTAFYRHKETGVSEMPPIEEMTDREYWNKEMQDFDKWEQTDFVRGLKGRMMIFSAPLFHSRFPFHGIGETPEEGRMVFVSHFFTS